MAPFQNSETATATLAHLGQIIRRRRKESGLRIDDAAALSEVSVDLLSRLENGKSGVATDRLLKVLDALGLALAVVDKTTGAVQRTDSRTAVGISTAEVSILRLPTPILVIKRFDRRAESECVRRLHIIDACQALNFPVAYKYERNFGSGRDVWNIREGVSFSRLFSLADFTVEKAVTRISLVRWALFQYLIGNADAHGKNVSFFCAPAGLSLSPAYDLVSVVQYPQVSHELAMAFGDEFSIEAVKPYDLAKFAQETKTPRSLLAREMRRMARNSATAAAALAKSAIYAEEERPLVRKIAEFVQRQAQQLNDMAGAMLDTDD